MKLIGKNRFLALSWMVFGTLFVTVSTSALAEYQLQPIKTRYAQTLTEVTLDGWYESFTDVEADEVREFDGWTAGFDLTVPFLDRFQLNISIPVRTEGDAIWKNKVIFAGAGRTPGASVDIEGNGGVFDFPVISFEHQLRFKKQDGYALSYYLGAGGIINLLDTGSDRMNHSGNVIIGGVRMDRQIIGENTLINLGLRYYERSDDLFPDGSSEFLAVDFSSAVIFSPWGGKLYPVLELTYLGDFNTLNQISVIPELIYPINDHLELKGGVEIGLGGNGSEFGGQAEVSVRF